MALIAWYPLNGDLLDYSGNSRYATNYGATVDNNGKIGKCHKFNGSSSMIDTGLKPSTNALSITMWVKSSSLDNSNRMFLSSGQVPVSGSRLYFGQYMGKWSLGIQGASWSASDPVAVTANWTFISIVMDGTKATVKADGQLVREISYTPYELNQTIRLGSHGTDGVYYWNGVMNDVRIYDHALSEKEIKEIAKAKILHYTFDDFQEPTTNLFQTPIIFVGNASNIGTALWNEENNFKIYGTDGVSGTAAFIAISAYTSLVDIPNITISLQNPININRWILRLYDSTGTIITTTISGWTYNIYYQAYYKDGMSNTTNLNIILPSSVRKVGFGVFGTGGGVVCSIDKLMIEAKSYTTPFVDSSRDGIINDQSGFRNNAILTEATTPQWVSDSKIGSGAYSFVSSQSKYISVSNQAGKVSDSITVSAWTYRDNWQDTTSERIISCTEGGGWQLSTNDTVGQLTFQLYVNGAYGPAGIALSTLTSGWHLITGVYDGRYAKLYVDGILKTTVDRGSPLIYNATNSIIIGGEPASGATAIGGYWNGKIDDVRIYATALSNSDILELYQTRASVDNSGNLMIGQVVENIAPATNSIPSPLGNGRFTTDNTWSTYNTNQYNNNTYFSIGTLDNITDNIVTLSTISRTLRTFDALNPQTTGGGVVAGTNYFIKKISDNQFTLHNYNSSQNGSQGYIDPTTRMHKVHENIALDSRVPINATAFPLMWLGSPHLPNTAHVKEIVENGGYEPNTNCMRVHVTRTTGVDGGMAYGVNPSVKLGDLITVSFWTKTSGAGIGTTQRYHTYFGSGYASSSIYFYPTIEWQKITLTWTASNTYSFYQYFSIPASTAPYYLDIADIQVQVNEELAPFTINTRLQSESLPIDFIYGNSVKQEGIASFDRFSELGITNGLIAYYPLDSNANDYSGNGNHGVVSGAVLSSGIKGLGYWLDGTGTTDGVTPGANIQIPEAITNTLTNDMTYSIWINVDEDAVDRMSLFFGASTIRHIEIFSLSKYFRTEAATQNNYSFGSGAFPDSCRGVWSHFTIVFSNLETNRPVRWYQNGKLFYTGYMGSGTNPTGEYFSFNAIGRATGSTSYLYAPSFKGKIDDFRIYQRALTESEISILYETTAPSTAAMKITKDTVYLKGEFKEVI